jgi:hypothetical protein
MIAPELSSVLITNSSVGLVLSAFLSPVFIVNSTSWGVVKSNWNALMIEIVWLSESYEIEAVPSSVTVVIDVKVSSSEITLIFSGTIILI